MTATIVAAARALETLQIHHATCRSRRQQLACSACRELAERCAELAERATRLASRVQVAA